MPSLFMLQIHPAQSWFGYFHAEGFWEVDGVVNMTLPSNRDYEKKVIRILAMFIV